MISSQELTEDHSPNQTSILQIQNRALSHVCAQLQLIHPSTHSIKSNIMKKSKNSLEEKQIIESEASNEDYILRSQPKHSLYF